MSRPAVESTLFRARRRLTEEYDDIVSGARCLRIQGIIVDRRRRRGWARATRAGSPATSRTASRAGARRSPPGWTASLFARPTVRERVATKVAGVLPFPVFCKLPPRRRRGGAAAERPRRRAGARTCRCSPTSSPERLGQGRRGRRACSSPASAPASACTSVSAPRRRPVARDPRASRPSAVRRRDARRRRRRRRPRLTRAARTRDAGTDGRGRASRARSASRRQAARRGSVGGRAHRPPPTGATSAGGGRCRRPPVRTRQSAPAPRRSERGVGSQRRRAKADERKVRAPPVGHADDRRRDRSRPRPSRRGQRDRRTRPPTTAAARPRGPSRARRRHRPERHRRRPGRATPSTTSPTPWTTPSDGHRRGRRQDDRPEASPAALRRITGGEAARLLAAFGAWRSLVARTVRVGEVPGSNPGAPMIATPSDLWNGGHCLTKAPLRIRAFEFSGPRIAQPRGTPIASGAAPHEPIGGRRSADRARPAGRRGGRRASRSRRRAAARGSRPTSRDHPRRSDRRPRRDPPLSPRRATPACARAIAGSSNTTARRPVSAVLGLAAMWVSSLRQATVRKSASSSRPSVRPAKSVGEALPVRHRRATIRRLPAK